MTVTHITPLPRPPVQTPVTCVTQHPVLGRQWGWCLCVWVNDASMRSGWHDRCEAHWAIMSCVQTDNFLADVCESFTNESQINTLTTMRHLRKQNVERNSTFSIRRLHRLVSLSSWYQYECCNTAVTRGFHHQTWHSESETGPNTSLNTALDYRIQQYSSSSEKNPTSEICETSVHRKTFYKVLLCWVATWNYQEILFPREHSLKTLLQISVKLLS